MGKAKKAHRKKVANRNQRLANEQKMVERMLSEKRYTQPQPSNFINLTGSDHQKYIQEYFNGSKE